MGEALYQHVALSAEGLAGGKLWTLLSYALFHHPTDWTHLGCNALLLILSGGRVCQIMGGRHTLIVLISGVLVGGVLQTLAALLQQEELHLIGISGGGAALLAAHLTALSGPYGILHGFPPPLSTIKAQHLLAIMVISTVILTLVTLFASPITPAGQWLRHSVPALFQISHACHLGGMSVGLLLTRRALR